ncbi:radical SAM protein [Clostridium sp. ATCC 25772]|uniref:SPL family radical SAM protein n=1 Tax=Clostridium sp. ATCC 25772 TaxID=1676991 RepID=UPI000783D4B3|nr:radical SAM protein [Clostridium sp. ATCC 25772]
MESIPCKTIITKNAHPNYWFGADYTMNIYRGCCHGCIYCDSRSSCYGIEEFDKVKIKKDALKIIEGELKSKRNKGVICTGAMSDPYNPFERKLNLTRQSLKLLNKYNFGVAIATKSNLITRDIDILKNINDISPVCVKMTITTFDDNMCKRIEPNVSLSSQRFKALEELANNGIYCGVLMMPILPFINDNEENIKSIIKRAENCGAKFIYPYFGVTLRDNQREYFYKKLDNNFPHIKNKYETNFRLKYNCQSLNRKILYDIFKEHCDKSNIIYNMNKIIDDYKYDRTSQLSFFD